MNINIIGAGPAGAYTAYLLAKEGFDVNLYEEHKDIGSPVQCTGIVTSSISDIIKLDKNLVVNKINNARIFAPNKEYIDLPVSDIIIDRKKFDVSLVNKAKKAGAKVHAEHKFIGQQNNKLRFISKGKEVITSPDIVIGADGPLSPTAKAFGMKGARHYLIGLQARVKVRKHPGTFEVYTGDVCPGFFAWSVPESKDISRIGLATKRSTRKYFSSFLSMNEDKLEIQAGLIPIYNPRLQTQLIKKNIKVYLVGDAATQVKATTGGGIIPGLKAAEKLAEAIISGKSYEKAWKKTVGKELNTHLRVRNMLNRFSDKDYNKIISLLSRKKNKEFFRNFDRDKASGSLLKLAIREPRLLLFARKVI